MPHRRYDMFAVIVMKMEVDIDPADLMFGGRRVDPKAPCGPDSQ